MTDPVTAAEYISVAEQIEAYLQASLASGAEVNRLDVIRELIAVGLAANPQDAQLAAIRSAALSKTRLWLFAEVRQFFIQKERELQHMVPLEALRDGHQT